MNKNYKLQKYTPVRMSSPAVGALTLQTWQREDLPLLSLTRPSAIESTSFALTGRGALVALVTL